MPMEVDLMSNQKVSLSQNQLYQMHSHLWLSFLQKVDMFPHKEYNVDIDIKLIRDGFNKIFY
jgi:hypothetical protein